MKLLDLFCGAGGAAMGYSRAGFEVVGVDIKPHPHYPFDLHQSDALEYVAEHGREFDAIHASPPCQFASEQTPMAYRAKYPNMIPATRAALLATSRHYVIENVENARKWLINPVMLCGSMFGLQVFRHRYFETFQFFLMSPRSCDHSRRPILFKPGSHSRAIGPVLVTGTTRRSIKNGGRFDFSVEDCRLAMKIDWMTRGWFKLQG